MGDHPVHFFKIIPPGFKCNLSIPRDFWTKLNGGCRDKPILRRGCREWPVDISNTGVFGEGWRKFVKENGVQEFDFIVFKQQGNMVFDFMVFDQSTCERQYPLLFDETDVEEPVTESDSANIYERSKKLKKRKRDDFLNNSEDKFQLDDDHCFMTKMTPCYIKSSRLDIPAKFARSNGLYTKRKRTHVVLMDEAQRTWKARLETIKSRIRLAGWWEFRIENHLKVGDVCMFELVKHGKQPVFKFYRKKPFGNHMQVKETRPTIKKATSSAVHNNQRSFISTLKPCVFKYSRLYIPVEFSILNGLRIGEMILRDDIGRSWNVQLKKRFKKSFYLGNGLKPFCDANGLKEGDMCKFELVENKKDKPPIVNFSYLDQKPVADHIQVKETRSTSKKATNVNFNHRYFVSTLKPSSLTKSGMYLPVVFSVKNGLKTGEMIIRDDKGRSWNVHLQQKGAKAFYLGCGHIRDFCAANGIKEGDEYKFELVENKKDKPPIVNISCTHLPDKFTQKSGYNKEESTNNPSKSMFVSK